MYDVDPLTALLSGFGVLLIIAYIFWPQKGLIARWKISKSNTERVLIENALKHLYNCEYNGISCSLNSIAGNLNISSDRAAQLVARLVELGLIITKEEGLGLTPDGREYALKIIRIHRLWEKYLADETSIGEEGWHIAAEEVEHRMSQTEADELAAQIGNPVYDPHGDPIPTAGGDLPVKKGKPLNSLKEGEFAHIIDRKSVV